MKRLRGYVPVELVAGLEEKIDPYAGPSDVERALAREMEKIMRCVNEDETLVVMDENGQEMTSEQLSAWLKELEMKGTSRISFVIGGANGLHEDLKKRAHFRLSMSRLTFLHQMAVLILTEQLYRAMKIQRGEPYHR